MIASSTWTGQRYESGFLTARQRNGFLRPIGDLDASVEKRLNIAFQESWKCPDVFNPDMT